MALKCACCPACGCDANHCALERFVADFPHLIIEHQDSPYVCKQFRDAALGLTGKPVHEAGK